MAGKLGRSAHAREAAKPDRWHMSELGLHCIAHDLDDTWLEDWAGVGVAEIESYLAKHAAFLSFLDGDDD